MKLPALSKTVQANIALSFCAFFWGLTFIFQRKAMLNLSPLAYTGLRFTLGAACLMPLALMRFKSIKAQESSLNKLYKTWLLGGFISGGLIFVGVILQQYGLIWTTAGKAAFITSLYVVVIPIILCLAGQKILAGEAAGALLAVLGLYFLSFTPGNFQLSPGDGLVLISTFVWAGQVLALAWLAPKMDAIILGTAQGLVCGFLALGATAILEPWPSWEAIMASKIDIFWGGVFSVTLGFTLQVFGQKNAKPAPASIIMEMEAIVAALAGWYYLEEIISKRMFIGILLMLSGMLLSQLWPIMMNERKNKIK